MNERILSMMKKEFIHIFRDPRTLIIIILMPMVMIVLYGYAITLDMRNIPFAVVDHSNTPASRTLVDAFAENSFFILKPIPANESNLEDLVLEREVKMILVVPRSFAEELEREPRIKVQLLIDASDPNVANFIYKYSDQIVQQFNRNRAASPLLFSLEPRLLYNPDMRSAEFFVPGLVAIILLLICALLTSITIAREKETGTLEQILVSPVHPAEIIVGKVIPYIVLGMIDAVLVVLSGIVLFDVPFHGAPPLLLGMTLLYVFASLALGVLISTLTSSQRVAMMLALVTTLLPTIMLSGFIFPIASMPVVLQGISYAIPARYYMIIIRGIMMKGVGVPELWHQGLILFGIGVALLAIAARRFKSRLEV